LTSFAANPPDFDREVAPILAGRCLDCHSGSEPKGKLDLSGSKAALAGGESGTALVAGKPDDSNLWQRIAADEMPPKHPLPAAERETIKRWIAAGAKWGTDPIDPFFYTTRRASWPVVMRPSIARRCPRSPITICNPQSDRHSCSRSWQPRG
jgi:hypothetical protein